jgi:hypothetical protein
VNDLNVCNHLSSKVAGSFKIYKGYAERFEAKPPGLMGFGQNALAEVPHPPDWPPVWASSPGLAPWPRCGEQFSGDCWLLDRTSILTHGIDCGLKGFSVSAHPVSGYVWKTECPFDAEYAAAICRQIAEGKTLTAICREGQEADPTFPSRGLVVDWTLRYPEFAQEYNLARRKQLFAYVDEIIDIADNTPVIPGRTHQQKLRIEARQWVLTKLNPEIFGDKLTINHTSTELPMDDAKETVRAYQRLLEGGGSVIQPPTIDAE